MKPTVAANTLSISHKGTSGFETNSTPDVCLTPSGPVPVPYKIISFSRDLVRGSTTVFADGGHSIAVRGSAHASCRGDEPGTGKGVASGTNMHESTWITYSPDVYVQGRNICRLSDKMFMNNRNCVSGSGGHYEPPAGLSDVVKELCRIFCASREEWHRCKRTPGKTCPRPSTIAKNKTNAALGSGGALDDAVKGKYGKGAIGSAEKAFFTSADKLATGARKIYDESAMKRAIQRKINQQIKKKIVQKGASIAARSWMKLVPVLNVVSTIYDVVDTAMTAKEVYDLVKNSPLSTDNAIRIEPDFGVQNAEGELIDVYDYKFDDPETRYQDKWQDGQEDAYKQASGQHPKKISNAECQCDKSPSGKSAVGV